MVATMTMEIVTNPVVPILFLVAFVWMVKGHINNLRRLRRIEEDLKDLQKRVHRDFWERIYGQNQEDKWVGRPTEGVYPYPPSDIH